MAAAAALQPNYTKIFPGLESPSGNPMQLHFGAVGEAWAAHAPSPDPAAVPTRASEIFEVGAAPRAGAYRPGETLLRSAEMRSPAYLGQDLVSMPLAPIRLSVAEGIPPKAYETVENHMQQPIFEYLEHQKVPSDACGPTTQPARGAGGPSPNTVRRRLARARAEANANVHIDTENMPRQVGLLPRLLGVSAQPAEASPIVAGKAKTGRGANAVMQLCLEEALVPDVFCGGSSSPGSTMPVVSPPPGLEMVRGSSGPTSPSADSLSCSPSDEVPLGFLLPASALRDDKVAAGPQDGQAAPVGLVAPPLASVGSAGHATRRCKPCAFLHREGCVRGYECTYCHECPAGEKKQRLKERRKNRRERNQGGA